VLLGEVGCGLDVGVSGLAYQVWSGKVWGGVWIGTVRQDQASRGLAACGPVV
jgi:hypothetical protein